MDDKARSLLEIHVAVVFMGLVGVVVKFIPLSPFAIVFWRVLFAAVTLLFLLVVWKKNLRLVRRRDAWMFLLSGLILAGHWTAFFHSVQISSVAIGIITFDTFPIFIAFLEPLFFKSKIQRREIAAAIVAFAGIMLVVPHFEWGESATSGVLWGTTSGFSFAILSLLNKKALKRYDSSVISFYQYLIAAVVLLPFGIGTIGDMGIRELLFVVFLGVFCSAFAHTIFIKGMKHVRVQTASIISMLESVYGIAFAFVLLQEVPFPRTLVGGTIILGAAIYTTLQQRKPAMGEI